MAAADTSIDKYVDMEKNDELEPKQRKVLRALQQEQPCTRRELRDAQLPEWELSSVAARTRELIDQELVEVSGRKTCSKSGNVAQALKVV